MYILQVVQLLARLVFEIFAVEKHFWEKENSVANNLHIHKHKLVVQNKMGGRKEKSYCGVGVGLNTMLLLLNKCSVLLYGPSQCKFPCFSSKDIKRKTKNTPKLFRWQCSFLSEPVCSVLLAHITDRTWFTTPLKHGWIYSQINEVSYQTCASIFGWYCNARSINAVQEDVQTWRAVM